jgi:hypothetical protein
MAGLNLARRRLLVESAFASLFKTKVFHCICDVDRFAIDACFGERLVQKFAGGADKRMSF